MSPIITSPPSRQQTNETQYSLDIDKKMAFDNFKERCASEGLLGKAPNSGEDDVMEGVYDDGTLLRFLRARKFDVPGALHQYKETLSWRDTNMLLSIYDSIDIKDYDETRKLYTHWTGRRDNYGIPVFLFDIGKLTPDVMSAYKKSCASATALRGKLSQSNAIESMEMLRLFCTYDSLVRFVLPLCSAVPGRPEPDVPVTQTNCIVDVSGTELSQFWRLRDHMQAATKLATSYYPETLGRTYIVGAPSFFIVIWGWLKKWLDPVTVSKIFIIPNGEELSVLSSIIDPVNIPQKYGGQLEYDFGMMPNLDPEIKRMLKWSKTASGEFHESLPIGPVKWSNSEDGKRIAVATGSVDGHQRSGIVATLVK